VSTSRKNSSRAAASSTITIRCAPTGAQPAGHDLAVDQTVVDADET